MFPQYVAARLSCGQLFEALESQVHPKPLCGYLLDADLGSLAGDCTQAIVTSKAATAGAIAAVGSVEIDRSKRCPRASSCLPCSQSLQAFPPVVVARQKKSSLWSTQSQSASNLSTPASTSNRTTGRALASVPPLPDLWIWRAKISKHSCTFLRRNLTPTSTAGPAAGVLCCLLPIDPSTTMSFGARQKFAKTFANFLMEIWTQGRRPHINGGSHAQA